MLHSRTYLVGSLRNNRNGNQAEVPNCEKIKYKYINKYIVVIDLNLLLCYPRGVADPPSAASPAGGKGNASQIWRSHNGKTGYCTAEKNAKGKPAHYLSLVKSSSSRKIMAPSPLFLLNEAGVRRTSIRKTTDNYFKRTKNCFKIGEKKTRFLTI